MRVLNNCTWKLPYHTKVAQCYFYQIIKLSFLSVDVVFPWASQVFQFAFFIYISFIFHLFFSFFCKIKQVRTVLETWWYVVPILSVNVNQRFGTMMLWSSFLGLAWRKLFRWMLTFSFHLSFLQWRTYWSNLWHSKRKN